MRTAFLVAVTFLVIAAVGGVATADDSKSVSGQRSAKLETTVHVSLDYLLYLPSNYEKQKSWPLMLFLHGSGERGDNLERVKVHGPPKLIAAGKQFPFIVVSPQCKPKRRWEPIELTALLDEIIRKYNVDEDRICVTGLSMGGFGAWQLAAYSPHRFAAIAPICGGGETYWARSFPHLATWVFHGAKDTGVPLERSQEMVDELTKRGGTPKLTIYPNAGHDSWTETYNNPKLYDWLLEQRRVKPQQPH